VTVHGSAVESVVAIERNCRTSCAGFPLADLEIWIEASDERVLHVVRTMVDSPGVTGVARKLRLRRVGCSVSLESQKGANRPQSR